MSSLSDSPPPYFSLRIFLSPPHPPPSFIGGIPLLDAAFAEFYCLQLDTTNAPLDSFRDAGIDTADGPHDTGINAGHGRDPGINKADGDDVESGANPRIDGKSTEVVPTKTRARAQSNKSGRSRKRGKADTQSGTDGAAETTSDHHETNGQDNNTAARNDDDAIKGSGDPGQERFRLGAPPAA